MINTVKKLFIREITLLILIIFVVFRGYISGDALVYGRYFFSLPSIFSIDFWKFLSQTHDKGFTLLMGLARIISKNYLFFQFCIGLITIWLIDKAVRQYSKYYVLPVILFFTFNGLFLSFNLIRNCISILIFINSIKYIEKRQSFRFFILNLFGAFIHYSSVIYIFLYPFFRLKISRKIFWFIFIAGNIVFLTKIGYVKVFLDFVSLFLPGKLGEAGQAYLIMEGYLNPFSITIGFFERFVTIIILLFLYRYFRNEKYVNILYNMLFIYMIGFYFFAELTNLMGRVMYLFVGFYWFLFPMLYAKFHRREKYIFLFILIFVCFGKMFLQTREPLFEYSNILTGAENFDDYISRTQNINRDQL
jgi:hypothetical protein